MKILRFLTLSVSRPLTYWKTSQNIAQENSACAVEVANDPQLDLPRRA